jgi:hypothetical protein
MKKYLFIFLLISVSAFDQKQNSEEQPKMIYTEKAKFPGGDEAFRAEFHKMVNGYIDLRQYFVNGIFYFSFIIDVNGKIKNLNIVPKVKNSDMFIEDMMFAMKKIKTKWKPALQNGQPVESKYILSVDFTSDHFDHGD